MTDEEPEESFPASMSDLDYLLRQEGLWDLEQELEEGLMTVTSFITEEERQTAILAVIDAVRLAPQSQVGVLGVEWKARRPSLREEVAKSVKLCKALHAEEWDAVKERVNADVPVTIPYWVFAATLETLRAVVAAPHLELSEFQGLTGAFVYAFSSVVTPRVWAY